MLIQMCPIWQNLQWIRGGVNGFLAQAVYTLQRHSMAASDSQYQKVPDDEVIRQIKSVKLGPPRYSEVFF